MANNNLYVLNYDVTQTTSAQLRQLTESLESVLGSYDRLIVLPNAMQLNKISTDELIEIRHLIDHILEGRVQ